MVDIAECQPEIRGLILNFDHALWLSGSIKWAYFLLRKSGFSVSYFSCLNSSLPGMETPHSGTCRVVSFMISVSNYSFKGNKNLNIKIFMGRIRML